MSGESEIERIFEAALGMLFVEDAPVIIKNDNEERNIVHGITPLLARIALNHKDASKVDGIDIRPVINAPRNKGVNIGIVYAGGRPAGFAVIDYFGWHACHERDLAPAKEPGKPLCELYRCDNARNAALWLPDDRYGDSGIVYFGSRKDFELSEKRPFFDKRHKRLCVMPGITWTNPNLQATGCLGDKTDVLVRNPVSGEYFSTMSHYQPSTKKACSIGNPACEFMGRVLEKYVEQQ